MGKEVKKSFLKGKMNKDIDERLLPDGVYTHAENIRISNSENSDAGAIENVLGNRPLTNLLLGTTVHTVGWLSDSSDDKLYWLTTSETGDYVIEYDVVNNLSSFVLQDTSPVGERVLNFDKDFFADMRVLVDTDNNTRLLFITDNLNPPREINIDRVKTFDVNGFIADDINLIKRPPIDPPTIQLLDTASGLENNIEQKFIAFSYRYRYLDGEYSALSPFTAIAFRPKIFDYNYRLDSNESMLNSFSLVNITINTGDERVTDIEVVFKESRSTTVYLVERYNKDNEGWVDDEIRVLNFSNSKIYRAIPDDQLPRLYDNVPRLARTLEVIGNRLVFGNYLENYDLVDSDGETVFASLELDFISNDINFGTPTASLKSNRDYEVGIVYLDEYLRATTVLTSGGNTVYIPNANCITRNRLQIRVGNRPPAFARYFRFFVKQPRVDYEIIVPSVFFAEGVFTWVLLDNADVNKISEGDIFLVKTDTIGVLQVPFQAKVLEIKVQERNFLEEDPNTDETFQVAGNYYRIDTQDFRLNTDDIQAWDYTAFTQSQEPVDQLNGVRDVSYIDQEIYTGSSDNIINFTASALQPALDLITTDIRYLIEIVTTGDPSVFRWSNDEGATFSSNITITGMLQELENGIMVTFDATTGFSTEDSWILPVRSGLDDNIGSGDSNARRGYSVYEGIDGETILGNASINLVYNEYNDENLNRDVNVVASRAFANIEEWYIGDNIEKEFAIPADRIWFRRGTTEIRSGIQTFTLDPVDGKICMIVRSRGYDSPDNFGRTRVKVNVYLRIFQSEQAPLFETIPTDFNTDIYYEIGDTFRIENGFHIGKEGDTSQTMTVNTAIITLPLFNCFAWGNGFESYKIRDIFNATSFYIDTRPLTTFDDYRANRRIASMTYSGVYEQTTNYNGINEFNLSRANFKDIDDAFESIQKLWSRDTDLIVFQEDKTHKVLFNKSILFNADGTGNVSQNTNVLGQEVGYTGEYGISKNPESFAIYGDNIYHTDARRGCVLRLSQNGYTEISNVGMRDFFRDHFRLNPSNFILAGYDQYHDQYVLHLTDNIQPVEPISIACGTNIQQMGVTTPLVFEVQYDILTGNTDINYNVTEGSIIINVVWNGITFNSGTVTGSGTFSYDRPNSEDLTATVTITPVGTATYSITPECSDGIVLTIVSIVLGDAEDAGRTINNRYRWGASQNFNSLDFFTAEGVVKYDIENGFEGQGKFPLRGSTIVLESFRDSFSQADFEVEEFDRLGFLVSSTLYQEADFQMVLDAATFPTITTENQDNIPETNGITFPFNKTANEVLYLIWDYTLRIPLVECNTSFVASGSEGIYRMTVNIGTGFGLTGINYDARDIPDRFQIEYDGEIVADSKFVGDRLNNPLFDPRGTHTIPTRTFSGNFTSANPPVAIFDQGADVTITVEDDDLASGETGDNEPTAGVGQLRFDKTTTFPQIMTIIVTGVDNSTAWDFMGICPPTPTNP